ncbi:hypothetical protein [Kovacikia minuta]|nr:hypothetical protein [Kovacikia minuta]
MTGLVSMRSPLHLPKQRSLSVIGEGRLQSWQAITSKLWVLPC